MSLILISFILAHSCCSEETKKDFTISDKYLEGKIMIRAESQHSMGTIWINGVFDDDESLESPRRGIVYPYESTSFNLAETVYFKIKTEDKLQYAVNVTSNKPSKDELYTPREYYRMIKTIALNFHNGDKHREGPFHKKRHLGPPPPPPKRNVKEYRENKYVKIPEYTSKGVFIDSVFVRLSDTLLISSKETYLFQDGSNTLEKFYQIRTSHKHSNQKPKN